MAQPPEDTAQEQQKALTEVLFVCLGDVCRSPAAHAIFQSILDRHGQAHKFHLSNRSTGGGNPSWYKKEGYCFQQGEGCDERMVKAATKRGVHVNSTSRVLTPKDVNRYDTIVAMDRKNVRDIKKAVEEWAKDPDNIIDVGAVMSKVVLMAEHCRNPEHNGMHEVPDPYYGGPQQFELVLDVLEDACTGLLCALCAAEPQGGGDNTFDTFDASEPCIVSDNDAQGNDSKLPCDDVMRQCC
eukprot:CAMPEP_0118923754 /NCGR_PEP_ID=MMETSP1169-20130426/2162_1 /TAXON_ID=36882 /ORGANISM="Pyramimonas obovata, Strain CCMP722" /LENGTH=239 /DNA_ID=CAMNT_0006864789 /DNA_START=530 /DNA_END=1249 /DNA_ORIENTATION=-